MSQDFNFLSELKNNSTFQKMVSNYFLSTEKPPIIEKVRKDICGFQYDYEEHELTLPQLQRLIANGGHAVYLPLALLKDKPIKLLFDTEVELAKE